MVCFGGLVKSASPLLKSEMMKTKYFSTVKNGRLNRAAAKSIAEDLARYEGKEVEISIEKKKTKRSYAVLGYYFAVVLPYCVYGFQQLGNDVKPESRHDLDLMHEFLKSKFLRNGRDIVDAMGEVHHIAPTLSTVDNAEICAYIEDVARFAAEHLNVVIPPAGSQSTISFND
jgi:hypothetical protein